LLGLVAILALGVLLDVGVLVSRRAALEAATDAAARAAYAACQGAPDAACAAEMAGTYLAANLTGAVLEQVDLADTGRVAVTASLTCERPFAALFHVGPVQMRATFGFGGT
jgi:Flp pilus assembly protein TadG